MYGAKKDEVGCIHCVCVCVYIHVWIYWCVIDAMYMAMMCEWCYVQRKVDCIYTVYVYLHMHGYNIWVHCIHCGYVCIHTCFGVCPCVAYGVSQSVLRPNTVHTCIVHTHALNILTYGASCIAACAQAQRCAHMRQINSPLVKWLCLITAYLKEVWGLLGFLLP